MRSFFRLRNATAKTAVLGGQLVGWAASGFLWISRASDALAILYAVFVVFPLLLYTKHYLVGGLEPWKRRVHRREADTYRDCSRRQALWFVSLFSATLINLVLLGIFGTSGH